MKFKDRENKDYTLQPTHVHVDGGNCRRQTVQYLVSFKTL